MSKTGGHYPAPLAAIDVVEKRHLGEPAEGLGARSARVRPAFGDGRVARARLDLLRHPGDQEGHRRARGIAPGDVRKLGVLGAGLMGSGIACVAAEAGVAVRLKDESLAGARARAAAGARRLRGAAQAAEPDGARGRPAHGPHLAERSTCAASRARDLVIEAVFEDLELKRRVLAEVEAVDPRDGRLREQHLVDPDRRDRAGQPAPGARARHALLLAGPEDAAARGRRHARDGPLGGRDRGGVRAPRRQARDRRARRPGLLHEPGARRVHERGDARARGGRRRRRARRGR